LLWSAMVMSRATGLALCSTTYLPTTASTFVFWNAAAARTRIQ
jgi:hypothetical protein